ncbi:hypothetical protein [Methanolobus chelungpuianus]|uniref:Uncharacterized protein n=1 Tax=Methanolobus chelungpuianus TaxID=502115 RepID=A0AAE3HC55_9EURY|nr:hypothetical protein [Methanolobus chelungpuianus]MCQ6963537.1 hypothetical protein [Methanolobus chelungpuianus]
MNLPAALKHALIEATIYAFTESDPSSRISEKPLTFVIPVAGIRADTEVFGITESDICATVAENSGSLSYSGNSGSIQFVPPFSRKCRLYDTLLESIEASTSMDPKATVAYDPSIREGLLYHFFRGSTVLMVPESVSGLSQLQFALMAPGSRLRAIMDGTGGWAYVFPKYIMRSEECGKMPARDTNVQQVLASYLEDMFPGEA